MFVNCFKTHLFIFYSGFDCVDRFPLLSALAGIMLALLKRSKPPRYAKTYPVVIIVLYYRFCVH